MRSLTKDDFVLDEEGQRQTIRYFSQESNLPLTLGLLIDTSGSQRRVLGAERSASFRFLEQVLREDKDKAFIIHFDREVELVQDLTSSRKKLEAALDLIDQAPQGRGGYGGANSRVFPAAAEVEEAAAADALGEEAPRFTMPSCSPPTS